MLGVKPEELFEQLADCEKDARNQAELLKRMKANAVYVCESLEFLPEDHMLRVLIEDTVSTFESLRQSQVRYAALMQRTDTLVRDICESAGKVADAHEIVIARLKEMGVPGL